MKPIQRNILFFVAGIFVSLFIIGFIRFTVPIIDSLIVGNLSASFAIATILIFIIYISMAIFFKSIFKSVWCCIITIILGIGVFAACWSFAVHS